MGSMSGKVREVVQAQAHKRRLETALSGIGGFCRGLDEIDVAKAVNALTDVERQSWVRHAKSYSRHLSQFAKTLSMEPRYAEAPQD